MGAILAGIIQGLGQHAAEQNQLKNYATYAGNEQMAQAFESLANQPTTSPADALTLHQMAYTARTKGAKAIPQAQQQVWMQRVQQAHAAGKAAQAQQSQNQQQQIGQAQGTVQQGVTGDQAQGAQGPVSRQDTGIPTAMSAPGGISPPAGNPTSAAAPAPVPAAAQTSEMRAAAGGGTDASSPGFGATYQIPGVEPGGFTGRSDLRMDANGNFVTVPRGSAVPSLPAPQARARWYQPRPIDSGPIGYLASPEERQEFAARGAALAAGATAAAQTPYEIERTRAQIKAQLDAKLAEAVNERTLRAEDLKKVTPIIDEFSRKPKPTMLDYAKLDAQVSTILGKPFQISGVAALARPQNIPGTVSGADAAPGTMDVEGKPVSPTAQYRRRIDNLSGQEEWFPTVATTGKAVMPDKDSQTGWSIFQVDREGNIQGKTPNAPPPTAYAPIIHNGIRQQVVDFGDHKELVPVNTQATSQRTFPGAPGAGAAGAEVPAATTSPSSGAPATTAPTPAAGGRFGRTSLGNKNLSPQGAMQIKNAIEVGGHQVWGDPDNPNMRSLSSYAYLADDPGSKQRLGQALRMVLDAGGDSGAEHMGGAVGPVSFSAGNLGTALSYKLGLPQAAANAKSQAIQKVFAGMRPDEVDYFNLLMNAIPDITGFRRITGGSAFKWSQSTLERELPMVGLAGVQSSKDFRQKLVSLGNPLLTAAKNLPGQPVDQRFLDVIRQGGMPSTGPQGITAPLPLVKTKAEFDALPSGTRYKEEDGNTYRKP
jgi:hypothetical protein